MGRHWGWKHGWKTKHRDDNDDGGHSWGHKSGHWWGKKKRDDDDDHHDSWKHKHKHDGCDHDHKKKWWHDKPSDDCDDGGHHHGHHGHGHHGHGHHGHSGHGHHSGHQGHHGRGHHEHGNGHGYGHHKKKHHYNPCPEEETNSAPVFVAPVLTEISVGNVGVGNVLVLALATDADGDTLVYSLAPEDGGNSADAEFFAIDPNTGEMIIAQDVSPFGDEDQDGTYEVTIQVSDGTETVSLDMDIAFTFGG